MAETAVRRWHSFDRRNKVKRPTNDHRVEDLAKRLRDAFEPDRELVGELMEVYRYAPGVLATAGNTEPSGSMIVEMSKRHSRVVVLVAEFASIRDSSRSTLQKAAAKSPVVWGLGSKKSCRP